MGNVKKVQVAFLPEERNPEVRQFRRAVSRRVAALSKEAPELLPWATEIVADADVSSALLELVSRHKVSARDLLGFLQEQRMAHVPARELRAKLREIGKGWKDVERLASRALKKSEPYLGELKDRAVEIERTARLLSKFFIEPVPKRPLEAEISECKQDILSFLRRREVREVNEYGWVLLRAVFGKSWRAGNGRDQIEAFRAIPTPLSGKIKTRKDVEIVMEKTKIAVFRMEEAGKK